MMAWWKYRFVICLLLICSLLSISPPLSIAEEKSKHQVFFIFEKMVFDLIDSGMEPLKKLDQELDKDEVNHIVLSAKQTFSESSLIFSKLEVPPELPDDIKASLEQIKIEFSTGFKALAESMGYYLQYLDDYSPYMLNQFIEKRDQGFLYIDGGFTSLATVRMQLNPPKMRPNPNTWEVGKRHLYLLEPYKGQSVPIESSSD